MGEFLWQCVWKRDAVLAERDSQCEILFAEEVCQADMEQGDCQSKQDVSEFHGHGINLSDGPRSNHRANCLGVVAKSPWFRDVLEFRYMGFPGIHAN